jgi:hypothetical protein
VRFTLVEIQQRVELRLSPEQFFKPRFMLVGPAGLLLEIRPALFRRGQRAPSRSRTGGDGLDFCGSEDPTDKARTFRVLTIMQASAWESMAGRRRFRMAMAATREQLGDDDADDHRGYYYDHHQRPRHQQQFLLLESSGRSRSKILADSLNAIHKPRERLANKGPTCPSGWDRGK